VPVRDAGRAVAAVAAWVALALAGGACTDARGARPLSTGLGDPPRGREAIAAYGCGACHTIPGVRGADSFVGPPLTAFGRRSFVAGHLPNTAENLVAWLRDPQAVRPGTAMPDLGVTEADALDIAAYLHSLR
jgi:cytochrome c